MKYALLLILLAGDWACCGRAERVSQPVSSPRTVRSSDLGESVTVIGPLDQPLGKLIYITGAAVPMADRKNYWSVNIARNLFAVTSVNLVKLSKPAWIELVLPDGQALPEGTEMIYRGYQDGGFIHPPDEVPGLRQESRYFSVRFFAIAGNATGSEGLVPPLK